MRTRHTMTLFLVLTLLTNLVPHERGSVKASGDVEKGQFTSRKRILDRLIRQGLASDRHQMHLQSSSQQHLYPATPMESPNGPVKMRRPLSNSLLQLIRSNYIPSTQSLGEDSIVSRHSSNSTTRHEMTNFYNPFMEESPKSVPALLRQFELSGDTEDSPLRRRHAAQDATGKASAKARRLQQKLERQRRRKEKRGKRNKEKSRRRKQSKRLKEVLEHDDVTIHNIDGEEYLDCCPSKLIVVEKQVGKDRNNHAVEVRPTQQYFYERVCLSGIEERECIFPPRALRKGTVTRCAQQFSYVQAQIRPYRSEVEWNLDYIHVRSGCSCQVSVAPRKKRKSPKKTNE